MSVVQKPRSEEALIGYSAKITSRASNHSQDDEEVQVEILRSSLLELLRFLVCYKIAKI